MLCPKCFRKQSRENKGGKSIQSIHFLENTGKKKRPKKH